MPPNGKLIKIEIVEIISETNKPFDNKVFLKTLENIVATIPKKKQGIKMNCIGNCK